MLDQKKKNFISEDTTYTEHYLENLREVSQKTKMQMSP